MISTSSYVPPTFQTCPRIVRSTFRLALVEVPLPLLVVGSCSMPSRKKRPGSNQKSLEQLKKEAELSQRRKAFETEANRYRSQMVERLERLELASRWQRWTGLASCAGEVKLVKFDPEITIKQRDQHDMWLSQGGNGRPQQATLVLKKDHTDMCQMTEIFSTHPLAVASSGYKMHYLYLDGKVNDKSKREDHESIYNVKFCTVLGFNLTFGYSRYKKQKQHDARVACVWRGLH